MAYIISRKEPKSQVIGYGDLVCVKMQSSPIIIEFMKERIKRFLGVKSYDERVAEMRRLGRDEWLPLYARSFAPVGAVLVKNGGGYFCIEPTMNVCQINQGGKGHIGLGTMTPEKLVKSAVNSKDGLEVIFVCGRKSLVTPEEYERVYLHNLNYGYEQYNVESAYWRIIMWMEEQSRYNEI